MHNVLPKTAQHSYLLTLHFSYTEDDLRFDAEDRPETVLSYWGILFSSQWLVLDSFILSSDRWYCIYSEFVMISILFISTVSFSLLILHTFFRRDSEQLSLQNVFLDWRLQAHLVVPYKNASPYLW